MSVGNRVEMPVDSKDSGALQVRLLGALTIGRDGTELALPSSRKVRGLFAYLALAPRAVPRSQLCELLWDVPNDPRGELRWCLSKIRGVIGAERVDTKDDTVALSLADCSIDARDVADAMQRGIESQPPEKLRALLALFAGDFLEGLEIDRSPVFNGWLTAQRRRFRGCHAALLEHLAARVPDDEALTYLEKWLQLAPFDQRVHEKLLTTLARRGLIREGEEHLAATAQIFEAEALDVAPLRNAWRAARAHAETPRPRAEVAPAPQPTEANSSPAGPARRASIAVMPFSDRSAAAEARGGAADALAYDVITRLAKLRSLFVIAQGTVFALHDRQIGPEEAGRMLSVDYVVSGSVRRDGSRLGVSVELVETRTARIVWAEMFNQRADDAFLVLDEIGNRIVASIANEIETIERNRAILRPPNSLDAWESYHRGLWHMYRFSRAENERAQHFFRTAVRLDPTFARAHAGLSFTHFQNAFQGWADRAAEIELAYASAGQSLMVDDRDPAAHWAMGRALWLRGQHEPSVVELEKTIDLSPNFALGHYTLAFVHSQAGDAEAAIGFSDHSRNLSPFDPLLFGMLGARAMALVRLKRFDEAAEWGVKAAARPNAHPHILAIAAYASVLAGRPEDGRAYMAAIQRAVPGYRVDDFLTAMQMDEAAVALYRQAAKRLAG
jgi:DNA-binding SARP family transcriptional activator/TolB-like protein